MTNAATLRGMGVADLAAAITKGEITAEAAVGASLDAISARNGTLNAFVSVDADEARAAAHAVDRARATGTPLGPLAGVPVAVKDMFWMAGKPMTGGSEILLDFVPDESATTITRLSAAGAIIVGRLNLSEFAASPTGTNKHFGYARNAHDTSRIPGGSSSGSGTAVAAGLVAGALGSDTGGSIRIPAALQGLVGLKPTQGRHSMHGTMPRAFSLDTVGPMTRHARDAALMMSVIAGPDPRDAASLPVPAPSATIVRVAPKVTTIALAAPDTLGDTAPSIVDAVAKAADALRRVGLTVRTVRLPDLTPLHLLADCLSKAEAATLHRRWMTERPEAYARLVYDRSLSGFLIPATRYIEAMSVRAKVCADFLADVLGDADALMLPTVAVETPTIAEVAKREAEGEVLPLIAAFTRLTRTFNYLGLPAITVPCGIDANGMPLAFQLVARPLAEDLLLGLADLYEREVGFGVRDATA